MSTQFTLLDALMEIEKNLKREKYDLGVIWRKMCHRLKNWFITCAGTIYQAEATFLGGGGLHFSNWRGRNTEYFAMTRMALGMQTYGAGKLSPTPRPPRNPARGGTGVEKLQMN